MAFVPEGQADSSHARSAWVATHGQSRPRSVQSSRWDGAIFLMTPGTSCLATIMLCLWDKIHSPAEALTKLALMGGSPGLVRCTLSRGAGHRLEAYATLRSVILLLRQ